MKQTSTHLLWCVLLQLLKNCLLQSGLLHGGDVHGVLGCDGGRVHGGRDCLHGDGAPHGGCGDAHHGDGGGGGGAHDHVFRPVGIDPHSS